CHCNLVRPVSNFCRLDLVLGEKLGLLTSDFYLPGIGYLIFRMQDTGYRIQDTGYDLLKLNNRPAYRIFKAGEHLASRILQLES
ncbi:MAG: hypothetical protein ACNS64_13410, partial [Candidatus Halalkalibacterium sp. M3_1C_030]